MSANEHSKGEAVTLEQKLRAALKWALEEGVYASKVTHGDFSDTGCGCCSGSTEPPAEVRDIVLEIQREIIDGK